jgi:hypothetical protein
MLELILSLFRPKSEFLGISPDAWAQSISQVLGGLIGAGVAILLWRRERFRTNAEIKEIENNQRERIIEYYKRVSSNSKNDVIELLLLLTNFQSHIRNTQLEKSVLNGIEIDFMENANFIINSSILNENLTSADALKLLDSERCSELFNVGYLYQRIKRELVIDLGVGRSESPQRQSADIDDLITSLIEATSRLEAALEKMSAWVGSQGSEEK